MRGAKMEKRQDNRFIAARGALRVVDHHAERLGRIAHSSAVKDLRQIVAKIDQFSMEQSVAKSVGPGTTNVLHARREDIMDRYVYPINGDDQARAALERAG